MRLEPPEHCNVTGGMTLNDSLCVDLFVAGCEMYWNLFEFPSEVESHSNVSMKEGDFVSFLTHFSAK